MSRIRTIKPEFFTSEDIFSLTPLARLFYVSLWCEADREGRLEWKPGTLKVRYLPADECDINALAQELTDKGLIELYEVDGKKYASIPTFTEHQVINNRESPSKIPARVTHASGTRKSGAKAEGKEGREGKGSARATRDADEPRFDPSAELSERGVQPQTIADWLALRKAQKAPVTPTVLKEFIAQADKAGMALERVLSLCCSKGWRGFKAEWVKDEPQDPQPGKKEWD